MNKQKTKKEIIFPVKTPEELSHISHEIKSFVASSKAYAQLLERYIKKNSRDTKELDYAEKVDIQLSKLNNQLSDFFDAVKLNSGMLTLSLEQVLVTDIIASAIELTKKIYSDHMVVVKDIPTCFIVADRPKMERVLVHLLTNAIKYSSQNKEVLVDAYIKNNKIYISITNEGITIPSSEKERIFDIFYQSKERGNQQGIGVGLYFAKEVLTLHKGKIAVNNSQGNKTTFTISLPIINT